MNLADFFFFFFESTNDGAVEGNMEFDRDVIRKGKCVSQLMK